MKHKKLKIRAGFPAVLMITALILSDRLTFLSAIIAAVLLHEAGHIFAARLLGIPLSELFFDILGAGLNTSGIVSYGNEILLCLSGPYVSFMSFLIAFPFCTENTSGFIGSFAAVSAALGFLNLLPVKSFDGGRALCALISMKSPRAAAAVLETTSLLAVASLWLVSVYLLLRSGGSLSLFVFSVSLFARLFLK